MDRFHAHRHLRIVLIGLLTTVLSACADEALLIPLNWSKADNRIVTIADVFDALLHKRSYKPAWPVDDAVAFIDS